MRYLWLGLTLLGGGLLYVLTLGKKRTIIDAEIAASKAAAKADQLTAEIGFDKATRQIKREYDHTIAQMSEAEKAKAYKLKHSPAKRAALYARLMVKQRYKRTI